ncbi:MAG: ABC transporter permease [Bacilli bacterium]|nr:ABC transporter permease [Bacilli bacterium]
MEKLENRRNPELFQEIPDRTNLHDAAFETRPVSFLEDSLKRFAKNKASIVAAIIIFLIALYAIIVPFASPKSRVDTTKYPAGFRDDKFAYALPYNQMFKGTGFWDGTKVMAYNENSYKALQSNDSNHERFVELDHVVTQTIAAKKVSQYYVRIDTYAVGNFTVTLSQSEYAKLVEHDKEMAKADKDYKSIIKPMIDVSSYLAKYRATMEEDGQAEGTITDVLDKMKTFYNQNQDIYYEMSAKQSNGNYTSNSFTAVFDAQGKVIPIYATDEQGNYVYVEVQADNYTVRVDYYDYLTYTLGFEPRFLFGANDSGQDICLRLAEGARFSLLLGIGISAINFIIGLIWGAVSGYYGGRVDMIMERVTDIIANIPSIIVLTICGIQFTNNIALKHAIGQTGIIILGFLVAFVYSGWVGVAGTTRMQFYRFKGQEYVLASRTLGAKDRRLIFKHILPNAIGTLVTSSVLMIPGVIFSESSLSFLGIIDFSSSGINSIGVLLNEGQHAGLQNNPHVLLFPCLVISLLMISFNLFGNGLRDAFNTSLKGSED